MVYVLAIVIYLADLLVKWIVQTHMYIGQSISVIPSVLYITYIQNPGAAWGIFAYHRAFLMIVPIVVSVAVIYFSRKYRGAWWTTLAYGLVLGGALGNLTDRAIRGKVIDYIYFKIINYPVFNLADMAVVVGIIILVWTATFGPARDVKPETEDVTK